mmetsp:Transcript_7941/g.10568  ORF Transcript_7941/g.10568 Transcript_7941/m.10568 type:complete len:149 (-) Transcript_7941:355-801(-)
MAQHDSPGQNQVVQPNGSKKNGLDFKMLGSIGQKSCVAGAVGATFGSILATYRGHSIPFYSVSMGMNYALVSTTYFGIETGLRHIRNTNDPINHAAAGFLSGAFLTMPFVGFGKGMMGGLLLGTLGVGGFYAAQEFDKYKVHNKAKDV